MNLDALREEMCEIGRRLYARGLSAGNDGNLSVRLPDDSVLCTPTLICKGFMRPGDLCMVDLEGRQLAGERRLTSEIRLHLRIYRDDPRAKAVVHCHPPHATAFAVAGVDLPTGILPEIEVFLGAVPRAVYETPGTDAFAATVAPYIGSTQAVLLSNHGTVTWAESLERAYGYTEMLEHSCKILMLAAQLGGVRRLEPEQVRALLALRPAFGLPSDPRSQRADPELYVNPNFPPPPR